MSKWLHPTVHQHRPYGGNRLSFDIFLMSQGLTSSEVLNYLRTHFSSDPWNFFLLPPLTLKNYTLTLMFFCVLSLSKRTRVGNFAAVINTNNKIEVSPKAFPESLNSNWRSVQLLTENCGTIQGVTVENTIKLFHRLGRSPDLFLIIISPQFVNCCMGMRKGAKIEKSICTIWVSFQWCIK